MIALGYFGALIYGGLCLLLASLLYKLSVPKKYTRKVVHILIGAEWFILYHTLGASLHFIAVCLIFTALIWISYKKSLMPMISSDKDNAPGTVYYCVSMTVMATVSYFHPAFMLPFGIAVLCTSVGDGFACVIGTLIKRNPKIYKNKSLVGTISAFLFSFISVLIFVKLYGVDISLVKILLIALCAAGLELITGFGLDNITIPLGCSALSYLLINYTETMNYIVPVVMTPFIIALVLEKKVLTLGGVVCAVICDAAVSVAFGNFGFVLLLSFLLLSAVVDKIKARLKPGKDEISKRGEHRDQIQVIANGIIPVIMAALYFAFNSKIFLFGYCAALTECFADTCASGFGVISGKTFDIFKMRKVPAGLSGGMSVLGTVASVAAAFAFALIPVAFSHFDIKEWAICGAIGFAGALFDSFLGSVAQAKFRCAGWGIITEKQIHCDTETKHVAGLKFIGNDAVNIISSAFSALLALLILPLL